MFQVLLPCHDPHVLISVQALQRALEQQSVRTAISPLRNRLWRGLAKVAGWLRLRRFPILRQREAIFFHLNHPWLNALYPYCLTKSCVTYSFDCWPRQYANWAEFFTKNRVRIAFLSARQSVAALTLRCDSTEFRWLPEAVDPSGYVSEVPLAKRPIDVLELGRRFEAYHYQIRLGPEKGFTHVFPERNRGLVFKSNDAVKAAFGQARICICFPQSMTHPERAGNVETATLRYFEAMAARCLLLGHCPKELEDLFGYSPVIEANLDDARAQLLNEILPRISDYQGFVARNYCRLLEIGTVERRALEIASALRAVEGIS